MAQAKSGRSLTPQEQILVKQGSQVFELLELPGWKEVLKPWLEQHIKNTWVDPRTISEEELKWKYTQAFLYASAFKELLDFTEKITSESEGLRKIQSGEVIDPLREALGG